MFQFYAPGFALLFPLPYLFRWYSLRFGKKLTSTETPKLYFPSLDRLKAASHANQKQSCALFMVLFTLMWGGIVLALMQPEKAEQFRHVTNQGHDLMLAVDTSGSMQAVDFSSRSKTISRLDATKEVVGQFALGREGDRVGLITFGESAYLHVPLTLDTGAVAKMLGDTVSGMAGNATAIGDAIGLAVRVLRDRPEGSRVLILLTDGADNASAIPPLEAAGLAKQYGIRIYTIGVGQNGVVPFPNGRGGYAMAHVTMDEELLKEIAALTGGEYFSATDKAMLESIYKKIDALEKTEANQSLYMIREPLYVYPLALAAFSTLALTGLGFFRRSSRHGK